MRGSEPERIAQCARANGWKEGLDYGLGMWLSYYAWRMVEDPLRVMEKELRKGAGDEDESAGGMTLRSSRGWGRMWQDPNGELSYGVGGLNTLNTRPPCGIRTKRAKRRRTRRTLQRPGRA
jgi:hypothetical protein